MATPNTKLEAARLKKCWSVAEASQRARVSVNTFNRWERGLQVPHMATLAQVCETFDMTPQELGFEDVVTPKREMQGFGISQGRDTTSMESDTSTHTQLSASIEIQSLMSFSPKRKDGKNEGISRRQAVALLLSAPTMIFSTVQGFNRHPLYPDEVLTICRSSIPLCWKLYFEGGLTEVKQVLPVYLSELSILAAESSQLQQGAASLASQALQLASLLALQNQDYGTALSCTKKAFHYGDLAGDACLKAAALMRQAYVYFHLKYPVQALQTYQEAARHSEEISALLRGQSYLGLAQSNGRVKNKQEAYYFLGLARDTFPENPETDSNFSYTHFNRFTFARFEGLTLLHLNEPKHAWEVFTRIDKIVPTIPSPKRVDLSMRQVITSIAMNELEYSCTLLETAVTSASALGSQLRINEAYEVYESMLDKWSNEARVKALSELFHQ
ncbi:MAG: helix-turn-helix domain-containing protein [Ktedonobacteraceae bacterium]